MSTDDRSTKIAMAFFLAAEGMFFAGLISAYWVLRAQFISWPPMGQPRLPITVTAVNTVILLLSGLAMGQTGAALKRGNLAGLVWWLGLSALGGLFFLGIQGYEWIQLIRFGLTTALNIYGGTFYIIVGAHAAHVMAALAVLLVVFFRAVYRRYSALNQAGVIAARMFWIFVVLVWPILYALLYF
ncbi:MAG: heme-copper oxidase subunit III [Deltaproteobacteria bacterium]|nr:heme-copper oxidase subunit III [Deltaproteobacteria bacterium]